MSELILLALTIAGNTSGVHKMHTGERVYNNPRHDVVCVSPKHEEGRVTTESYRMGTREAGCDFSTVELTVTVNDEEVTPSQPAIVAESTVETVKEESQPEVQPERERCNNGEGNGAEGCSPSENGNNDENSTRPNEDHGHP